MINKNIRFTPRKYMEDFRKCAIELKELSDAIIRNFKEDVQIIKRDLINSCKIESDREMVSSRKFNAVIPLPREIQIVEKIECVNKEYYVTYNVKCGLRHFNTTLYLGEKPSGDVLMKEMRDCINAAIAQCLQRDSGQIQEINDSGKVVNIQSLN